MSTTHLDIPASVSPLSSAAVSPREIPAFMDGSNGFNMKYAKNRPPPKEVCSGDLPIYIMFLTYGNFVVCLCFSYIREAYRLYCKWRRSKTRATKTKYDRGYARLLDPFNTFFEREMYGRIRDIFGRPISSPPGTYIDIMERNGSPIDDTLELTGKTIRSLNLSSYNYLGFAETEGPFVEAYAEAIDHYGITPASPRMEYGTADVHTQLETVVADFLGKEAAIIYGMGYITNASSLPALLGKGCLVVSDSLNHASIVVGCRQSGAAIKVFKHNDPEHLDHVMRKAIIQGQPRTHRPWKKILIIVEGIYSMEGEIVRLPEIVEIKKKYKAYLYLDEAHSIGALGKTGRGACEYWGVDPADIDIMMGTFTKSFAAVGGYVAGSAELIRYLRMTSYASVYDTSLPVPLCRQILNVINLITGKDESGEGTKRIDDLARNVAYFRKNLSELGFDIIGDDDSPVVPLMVYVPNKMPAFARMCLEEGLAVVTVSYPATDLMMSRARFCVSAGHTIEDLDFALEKIKKVGDACLLRYRA